MKTIAVLITSFNRKEKTIKCLENLFKQKNTNSVINVFLVDDGSTDGTAEAVLDKFPQVQIIEGDGSLYWNRGMHKAWAEASKQSYEFYLWLNDDTFLFEEALKTMLEILVKVGREVIVVGATCSVSDKELTTYGGRNGKKVIQIDGILKECTTFNGNCVLIPSSVYAKLGNLDFRFRHSFGDIEYGMRAVKNKVKIYIAPNHIGTCETHDSIKECFSPKVPFIKRLKHFYSPLGMNPLEFFYMNKKYKGLPLAIKVFITTHLRVCLPKVWLK